MQKNGARCDRKTEAHAFVRRSVLFHTEKGLEHFLEILVGNTRPTIFHNDRYFGTSFPNAESHTNSRSCIRELHGIANNVFTGSPKRFRISEVEVDPRIQLAHHTFHERLRFEITVRHHFLQQKA